MKRYKLLKDLPTFKAGQLAYVSSLGNLMAGTPDFESGKGGWMVYYDHGCETLAVCELDYYDDGEIVRYKTREEAEKSIEENREDWKIYFGIDPSDTNES